MKDDIYRDVHRRIQSLTEGESDIIAVMATVACELYHAFEVFNWVGFYRLVDSNTLKVGPYQGTHGCLTIDVARGVCGKCVREAKMQIENDVARLPHHIACSPLTRAEIVLPLFDRNGEIRAVLDIDAAQTDVFDEVDARWLQEIGRFVCGDPGSPKPQD